MSPSAGGAVVLHTVETQSADSTGIPEPSERVKPRSASHTKDS